MGTESYGIAEPSVFYAAGLQSHREYETLLLFMRPMKCQDAGEGHSRKLASAQFENSTKVVQVVMSVCKHCRSRRTAILIRFLKRYCGEKRARQRNVL